MYNVYLCAIMKSINKKFIITLLVGVVFALPFSASAAIDAKVSFESVMPIGISATAGSELSLSDLHFKDGAKSLRWSWSSPSEMHYADYGSLKRSFNSKGAGVMFWVYNTKAMNADMRVSFYTPSGEVPYWFDFHMDFTGWRACWIKHADMPGDHSSKDIMKMVISTPAGIDSGEIFIDRLTFADFKLNAQICPDQQIPNNNCNLKRTLWHWTRLWEWEQYEYQIPLTELSAEQVKMLDDVKSRIESIVSANMSSIQYINSTIIPRALKNYEKAAVRYNADGSIVGAPLLSNDECNRDKGELRLDDIENMLYAFALNSFMNRDDKYDDHFFKIFDHAIDQGFTFGHGNGTNHHYGYNIRKIYDASWLMRDKIAERGKTEEYGRVLAYWSGLAETRIPYVYGRDELLDAWHTLLMPKLISALMMPTEAQQYQAMKSLGVWLSGSLAYTPGTIGGIKPDGTTFHHGGLYPGYSTGAFAMIGYYCKATRGTDFTLDEPSRRTFKHALMTMDIYTNQRDWGVGVAGRHPFNKNNRIPDPDVNAFGYLASLGDLTGSGKGVDVELAAAYLRMKGTDKSLNTLFKKEGITPSPSPEGFFALNYGAVGLHRRDNWMVTLKAYNSDVWCSEMYAKDNRYGRYQSYGTMPIIATGNPVSAVESGFVQSGWDWNRMPGATTIHLPWDLLNNPRPGTLMDRNPLRFAGVSSLEGRNGVMAFQNIERNYPNYTEGATVKKSVFCFDNRMVCLGSDITNNNAIYPTETTLYQLYMTDQSEAIELGGNIIDVFPYTTTIAASESAPVVLSDTKWNYYVVREGSVNIARAHQSSPNDKTHKMQEGNFTSAWLNHGAAPQSASYEYEVYVQPSNKEVSKLGRKRDYEVLRRDSEAHIVRDLITGITGYVFWAPYTDNGLIKSADGEIIVMQRQTEEGELVMSLCTPDLGLTEKTYTTRQELPVLERGITLDGEWVMAEESSSVETVSQDNTTRVVVKCQHGRPVDFRLKRK